LSLHIEQRENEGINERDAVNGIFPDRALKRFDVLRFVQHDAGCGLDS